METSTIDKIWRLELKAARFAGKSNDGKSLLKQRSDTIRDAHLQIQTGDQDSGYGCAMLCGSRR